ncbi:hypothetical protein KP509_28G053100 [Ceratopteris richardii]|uniref:ZF-HD dimerization-type domain-containing protein n=1 Tax=Ceratopteris richardii TaxID=49495 RepID=A0A8T2RC51_CERRI|nr:hypothetical protein KP509_28G053100 [Ceratopteris richardii]
MEMEQKAEGDTSKQAFSESIVSASFGKQAHDVFSMGAFAGVGYSPASSRKPMASGITGPDARLEFEVKLPGIGSTRVRRAAKYRECLKNHAASLGGHALDGCGEFMPGGEEGTLEALKCAACDCHRNFHRRELEDEMDHTEKEFLGPLVPPIALMPPSASNHYDQELVGANTVPPFPSLHSFGGSMLHVKRFRTKFTTDQKERMWEFAEKIGWRIQKDNEQEVQRFCGEVGVKRHVLKVWMHNHKNALTKKPL